MLSGRTNEMERTLLQVRPKCLIYNALGISDELRIAYGLCSQQRELRALFFQYISARNFW
jgi:hypothetical protein